MKDQSGEEMKPREGAKVWRAYLPERSLPPLAEGRDRVGGLDEERACPERPPPSIPPLRSLHSQGEGGASHDAPRPNLSHPCARNLHAGHSPQP